MEAHGLKDSSYSSCHSRYNSQHGWSSIVVVDVTATEKAVPITVLVSWSHRSDARISGIWHYSFRSSGYNGGQSCDSWNDGGSTDSSGGCGDTVAASLLLSHLCWEYWLRCTWYSSGFWPEHLDMGECHCTVLLLPQFNQSQKQPLFTEF